MDRLCCFCLKKKSFVAIKKYMWSSKRYNYRENVVPITYKRHFEEPRIESIVYTNQHEVKSMKGLVLEKSKIG